jgi:hypothetical protein
MWVVDGKKSRSGRYVWGGRFRAGVWAVNGTVAGWVVCGQCWDKDRVG